LCLHGIRKFMVQNMFIVYIHHKVYFLRIKVEDFDLEKELDL